MRRRTSLNATICIILTAFLILETLLAIGITVINKTIGNKDYIIQQLKKVDYYQVTKAEIEDSFKYYVLQANLDDSCVTDLITAGKVKNDTLIILNQCFEDDKTEIEIESIKQELQKRIHNKVENEYNNLVTETEKQDIDTLVDMIVENYTNNMETIKTCFKALAELSKKQKQFADKYKKIIYIATIITTLLLSGVYIFGSRNFKIILNKYHAVAFMTVGILLTLAILITSILIKEEQIQLFTKGITILAIDTITTLKTTLYQIGIITFMIGLSISLAKNIIIRKYLK